MEGHGGADLSCFGVLALFGEDNRTEPAPIDG